MPKEKKEPHSEKPAALPQMETEMFRTALEVAPNPMVVVVEDGAIIMANQAAVSLFGYEAGELVGQPVEVLLPSELRGGHRKHRDQFIQSPQARPMGDQRDLRAFTKDGKEIPVEIGLSPIKTPTGIMVIASFVDLTVRKQAENELEETARRLGQENEKLTEQVVTDGLTAVRTRQAFMDQLAIHLEVSVRHARPLSVLILDIDRFKQYNDDFGHLAGDEVLRKVGKILMGVARRSDCVARLGGEEFGIILPETEKAGSIVLGERFREGIEAASWPNRLVTVSIGGTTVEFQNAVPRPPAPEIPVILTKADRALYLSKAEGRNRMTHASDMDD